MSNYWLFVLTEDNLKTCVENNLVATTEKKIYLMKKIKRGDKLCFYLTRKTVDRDSDKLGLIGGEAEVKDEMFLDDRKLFSSLPGEIYPVRCNVQFQKTVPDVDIKKLMDRLSFISSDSRFWGVKLRNGIIQLTENDWNAIQSA